MVNSHSHSDCTKCGLESDNLKDGICSTCIMIQELDEAIKVMDEALEGIDVVLEQHRELMAWVKQVEVAV